MDFASTISHEFNIKLEYISNILKLLDEGNTVPFIARYRKEMHGTLDDQSIRAIAERYEYLQGFDKRREAIRASIESQGKLTEEISRALDAAQTMAEIEDIYLPYKQKRRTHATIARERGLEPLAAAIFAQEPDSDDPIVMAEAFINPEVGLETAEDALTGALYIIAEDISDNATIRKRLRNVTLLNAKLVSKAANAEAESVYEIYYDFSEALKTISDHRILAINRGEKEDFLKVSISLDAAKGHSIVYSVAVREGSPCTAAVISAADDAYDRLIFPAICREIRSMLTERASDSGIGVFSVNLRQLLMQPPIKNRVVIGLDPGYRNGCKVAVVDATGKVLDTGIIYVTMGAGRLEEAKRVIKTMCKKHGVSVFAIGNGTASRETERFAADLIAEMDMDLSYMMVSEAGASVYSASKLAAEEFPDFDVNLRSAVSIARRLQDPLAEIVKIDPKAIGVGQYQHDMNQKKLTEAVDGVVQDCVSSVGVDLNTASAPLLASIAGITASIAKNIVAYREQNGAFTSRKQLLKVKGLGPKAFEQCAGFMRVAESANVLDNTAVHPESYEAAKLLLTLCGYSEKDVRGHNLSEINERIAQIGAQPVCERIGVGMPTLEDIVRELLAPGRDVRDELPPPLLRTDVLEMSDLAAGMELQGTVRNVVDFGAFVDIGVHEDGLVHISQICRERIGHPSERLKVGDVVTVWVLDVDLKRKRIGLTMRGKPEKTQTK